MSAASPCGHGLRADEVALVRGGAWPSDGQKANALTVPGYSARG